jgi:oligopeptidase B
LKHQVTPMLKSAVAAILLALAGTSAAIVPSGAAESVAAPVARVVPKEILEFGRKRIDNYDWLRDRDDPQVIELLRAENAYADAKLAPLKPLVTEIAAELRARSDNEDVSVPYADNGYLYERRFARGAAYPIIVRRKDATEAPEQIVLDVGALAAGHGQYRLGSWTVSPDNSRVAFAVDFTGDRDFHIFVRDLATGEVSDQGIGDVAASLVFAADSTTLFYVRNEAKTVRSYQVWRHRVGADAAADVLVYEEKDPTFSVSVEPSKSRKFIFIEIDEERTSEVRYLDAGQPAREPAIMAARRHGVLYHADHVGDRFFIRTNLAAPDYRIVSAPEATPDAAHWTELLAEQPGQYLGHFEAFDKFIALDVEHEGNSTIRVFRLSDLREISVPHSSDIGVASTFFFRSTGGNRQASSNVLRFRFTAPLQPQSIYDFDMATAVLTLRKQDPATKWFKPEPYGLERIYATAPDGGRVPVTVAYRKDLRRPGGNPTLIAGYGAYGISSHPIFNDSAFSLIDRGFVYAIAHVRGGHENGESWYEEGRMLNKRNTFTDFIAATEAMVTQGFADRKAVFAEGHSAGGLLVGAIANMRPDLYAGIVAEVPFVDLITTMSDASVPLTTLEYEEWGNPAVERQYDYMLSYSPYDNVRRQNYPAMFVTAGFYDSQVSYAEPAKWVARLRASKTDDHDILFKTNLAAGHGGRSGRLGSINESAEIMAWLLTSAADSVAR